MRLPLLSPASIIIKPQMLIKKDTQNSSFYQFLQLTQLPRLTHGIFLRRGGHSNAPYAGLNVSFDVGDKKEDVIKNRLIIKKSLGMPNIVSARQVHGTKVRIFSCKETSEQVEDADALITDIPGSLLLVKAADCQAIIIYDPKKKVAANVHSGWRGSVGNIAGKTVANMTETYGCQPQSLICGIGPSLGPCCAEYKNHVECFPVWFKEHETSENHFNFWEITNKQLQESGVLPNNIITSGICTKCNMDKFYSYRGEQTTGRFAVVIGISE
ncbi:MAG: peptidoglycan editing factor PgeF [Pseudomonadota bacterium]